MPKTAPVAVFWAGPSRIVWACPGKGATLDVWTTLWPVGTARLAGSVTGTDFSHSQPGRPAFGTREGEWWTVDPKTGDLVQTIEPQSPFPDEHETTSRDGRFTFRVEDETRAVVADRTGKEKAVSFRGSLWQKMWHQDRDLLWVKTTAHDVRLGTRYWLYTVDWAGFRLVPRVEDYSQADFWPTRDTVAFCKTKTLARAGSKRVWVAPLYVGSVRTTKYTKAVGGLAHVVGASLRPQE